MALTICSQLTPDPQPGHPGTWRFYVPDDGTTCNGNGVTVTDITQTHGTTEDYTFKIATAGFTFSGLILSFANVGADGSLTNETASITLVGNAGPFDYPWGSLDFTVAADKLQATLQVTNENPGPEEVAIHFQLTITNGGNVLQTSNDPQIILDPGN